MRAFQPLRGGLSRRSLLGFAALGAASAGLRGQPAWALRDAPLPVALQRLCGTWTTSFADDFTDAAAFDERWIKVSEKSGVTKSVRLPENVAVSPDGLALQLRRNPDRDDTRRPYVGGYVRTRAFRQQYGYFECEMRIANEPGVNNAFWLTSDRPTEGDTRFELDVVEAKFPNVVQVTARRWLPDRMVLSKTHRAELNLASSFHRYGMLWEADRFQFFFDDEPIYEVENTFAHTPAQLLISNAVAGFAGKDDGDVSGAATVVRQVRIFQNQDGRPTASRWCQ
ncbi:glycoside hydrolase family 16 protein [Microvirga antarctica]|uniref:glycoside hydrolase family 16 protein n=1 Tax=Microvirga antarctica TaxID=2819233 RepID=UPI001B3102E2|nr:glycoside hydrolase family 16 protein [Microvirga antarctica]